MEVKQKIWVCIVTILKIVAYKYLAEIAQATLLIIGGVHKNPGPITREKDQLQIITQNVRGMIEVKKKKLIINKCHESFKENPSTIIGVQETHFKENDSSLDCNVWSSFCSFSYSRLCYTAVAFFYKREGNKWAGKGKLKKRK